MLSVWPILGTCVLLLLLEFVQLAPFQATRDVPLLLAVVRYDLGLEAYGILDWHEVCQRHRGNLGTLLGWRAIFMSDCRSLSATLLPRLLQINPFQSSVPLLSIVLLVLNNLSHLGVEEGVPDHDLFLLEVFLEALALEGKIIEVEREWAQASIA